MPFIKNSSYKVPLFLFNKHLETVYPALFRKIESENPLRERLELPDGDFLDLDWFLSGSKKLIILNHGLEGNSTRPYMLGMINAFKSLHWDVLAWNFRSCSGEMNRLARFYHSGETYDLDKIVNHASKSYESIVLIGFSLGGNMMLKYIGENGKNLNKKIKSAAAFSVPIDLLESCYQIMKPSNYVYERRFLQNLKLKVLEKSKIFPETFDLDRVIQVKSIMEFDDLVTAPLHGFKNALDYYEKSSAKQYLNMISIPTLLVNAKNDPMLSPSCFPNEIAINHPNLFFELWKNGGHVGFYEKGDLYASEKRAVSFIKEQNL